jgi:hypothetical protein
MEIQGKWVLVRDSGDFETNDFDIAGGGGALMHV